MQRTELTKKTAKYKGFAALGSATATTLFALFLTPYFLVLGVPVTAFLTFRWLQYRAKWGLRF